MELIEYFRAINAKKWRILLIVIIFIVISAVFTFSQPLKYKANSKVTIIQDLQNNYDPFIASKSNQYLSGILAQAVSTEKFYNQAVSAGFKIDKDYFTDDPLKREKLWQETIEAKPINDTGAIEINIYHSDKYQLEQLARAVNYTLALKHGEYDSLPDKVKIEVLDEPTYSDWPKKPDIVLNLLAGLAAGLVFALWYVYLFPDKVMRKQEKEQLHNEIIGGQQIDDLEVPRYYSGLNMTRATDRREKEEIENNMPAEVYTREFEPKLFKGSASPAETQETEKREEFVKEDVIEQDLIQPALSERKGSMSNIFGNE